MDDFLDYAETCADCDECKDGFCAVHDKAVDPSDSCYAWSPAETKVIRFVEDEEDCDE